MAWRRSGIEEKPMTAMQKLGQGGFSIGLELPLDND
jgi:hypothetical protein